MPTLDPRQLNDNSAITDGVTCVTQTPLDNSTKLASTAYTDSAVSDSSVNLGYTESATQGTITNDKGDNAVIPDAQASSNRAGLLRPNILGNLGLLTGANMADDDRLFIGDVDSGVLANENLAMTVAELAEKNRRLLSAVPIDNLVDADFTITLGHQLRYIQIFDDVSDPNILIPDGLPIGFEFYAICSKFTNPLVINTVTDIVFNIDSNVDVRPNGGVASLYKFDTGLWNITGELQ